MAHFSSFSKWFYRGEGNKTLVISNPDTRQVLRLQKSSVSLKNLPNFSGNTRQQEVERCIKFYKQVFIPLLSRKYVEPGTLVQLSAHFMEKIKDLVTCANKERPKFRLSKEVSCQNKFGILMPDFCFVSDDVYANDVEGVTTPPTFCVEIKPKCGTLPTCSGLEKNSYREVKESVCKFCLLQWTKVNKEGEYPRRSSYCPIDLFSSDIKRVWHALTCLLYNPQNNFRIFQDGTQVYFSEAMAPSYDHLDIGYLINKRQSNTYTTEYQPYLSQLDNILEQWFPKQGIKDLTNDACNGIFSTELLSITMFLATLLQLLVHDSKEGTIDHDHDGDSNMCNHPVCKESTYDEGYSPKILTQLMAKNLAFGQGGVLRKILDVQKLDCIGSDEAFIIFDTLCSKGHQDAIDSHNFGLWKESCDCNIVGQNKHMCAKCEGAPINIINCDCEITNFNTDCEDINDVCTSSIDNPSVNSLTKFLIAASANDCSIMISFHEVVNGSQTDLGCFEDVLTGKIYKYSIGIVDLDQKESGRIPKYYKDYHSIIDNYLHFNKNV